MAEVFISYASQDRSRIEPLAKALEDQGWSVFWDRTIPAGKTWREVIGEALENARSVIVVWSITSVKSRWVQEEADWGLERKILIPIFIDHVRPPLGFGAVQAEDLTDWDPSQYSKQFEKLISDLSLILGPSPLKVKTAKEKRAEETKRLQQEEERKLRDKEIERLEEEARKQKEAERKAEEEKRSKEQEEQERKDEDGQQRREKEERKRRALKTEAKTDKLESGAKTTFGSELSEPRKKSNTLKIGAASFVAVMLIAGLWWLVSRQQPNAVRQELEKISRQVFALEDVVEKIDKPEQLTEFARQRDAIIFQLAGISEQATKAGFRSQLAELQKRLKQAQTKLTKKEKVLIANKKGAIFLATSPDNATVKILNIDASFQQGMALEPGSYLVEVAAEGYETERRWIDLVAGNEKPFRFELTKIKTAEPASPEKVITNSIGMKFVLIPSGTFVMGSPIDEPGRGDDEKQHEVRITKQFYLQTTEVSQGQWKKAMGINPSNFKDCGDDCPVESVSWDDAQEFINKLNQMEGTNKYRLPTEAEWEYSCRAGTETAYSFGNMVDKLGEYAWFADNSEGPTYPGGKKMPNAWGLYDMHGNVWEWCQDLYGKYPTVAVIDPKGPNKGKSRVLRGGSWGNSARLTRSAIRNWKKPGDRNYFVGFRVARDF